MRKFLAISLLLLLSACSPGFYMRAMYEETKILIGRDDIEDVIEDEDTTPEERDKLKLVLDARDFAISMGLAPGDSFTKYTHVDKNELLWVVAGSKKDSFSVYEWWFPFVGKAPYKGFFDQEDALAEARNLQQENFETFVRGSDAFSTLGWFNDPVLTTTLRNEPTSVANTVIHETLHATVWIPGNVPFNESLANFVGLQGAAQFYEKLVAGAQSRRVIDAAQLQNEAKQASHALNREMFVADVVDNLYRQLDSLYASNLSRERKLAIRGDVFAAHTAPLRQSYPELKILKEINNAEIMQFKFYLTGLRDFEELFLRYKGDWSKFIAHMQKVKELMGRDEKQDPFALMRQLKMTEQ